MICTSFMQNFMHSRAHVTAVVLFWEAFNQKIYSNHYATLEQQTCELDFPILWLLLKWTLVRERETEGLKGHVLRETHVVNATNLDIAKLTEKQFIAQKLRWSEFENFAQPHKQRDNVCSTFSKSSIILVIFVVYSKPHAKVYTRLLQCDNEQHDGMVDIFKMNINCVLEFVKWPSCMMHSMPFTTFRVNEIMYKKYI